MGKRIACFCLLLWGANVIMAQRLPVRLAEFQVYDKAVEGFELLLPLSAGVLRESLVAHLQANTSPSSIFEDLVLCEQVRYAPISVWQPISLIFLLEPASPHTARLRVAALIDYKTSITPRQFPDLALRLLLDLDLLVRNATGQSLDFDALYAGLSTNELRQQYENRLAQQRWNLVAERRPEEVVQNAGLYLRASGISADSSAERLSDEAVVGEMSRRLENYLSNASLALSPSVPTMPAPDSLSRQMWQREQNRADSLEKIVGEQAAQLALREEEMQGLLARLSSWSEEAALPLVVPERDSLRRERELVAGLRAEAGARRRERDSLLRLVTILEPDPMRVSAREAIYLRQLARLEAAQEALAERNWEVSMREKLMRQREQFWAEQEADKENAAMIQRISDLEEALRAARERAQRAEPMPLPVEPGMVRSQNQEIPALVLRSALPLSWVREQCLSWASLQKLPVEGREDLLVIVSDQLPGLEGQRFRWQMSLLARGEGTLIYATFQDAGGQYLDVKNGDWLTKQAEVLLQAVFQE